MMPGRDSLGTYWEDYLLGNFPGPKGWKENQQCGWKDLLGSSFFTGNSGNPWKYGKNTEGSLLRADVHGFCGLLCLKC